MTFIWFLHDVAEQPFMGGPRYPGGPRPGVRMPQMGPDFGGVS